MDSMQNHHLQNPRRVKQEVFEAEPNQNAFNIKPEPMEHDAYEYPPDPVQPIPNNNLHHHEQQQQPPPLQQQQHPIFQTAEEILPQYSYTDPDTLPITHQIVPRPLLSCYSHPASQHVPTAIPALPITEIHNQTYLLKKAKADLYNRDLVKLSSRIQLVEYLLKQSSDHIPESDPLLMFNCILATRPGIVGADHLGHVSCFDDPNLDTFICLLCQYWTTESDMFKHLKSEDHRVNYMQKQKNYKTYHAKILCQQHPAIRSKMINDYACKIAAEEGIKKCETRMRVVLNAAAIARIWPEYLSFADNSWQSGKFPDDEDIKSESKVEVKQEDEFGEEIDAKPNFAKLKAHLDLEDGEISDSDEENDEGEEDIKYPTTSISLNRAPLSSSSKIDIKPKIEKLDIDQRILTALVLIRQEAHDPNSRNFNRGFIEFLCKETGISPNEAMNMRNIREVGERLGDGTFADSFGALTEYYHDKTIRNFDLPPTPPSTHASIILTQMGIEMQQIAILLRTIAMHKMNQKAPSPEPEVAPSINSIERDKHGSIIHKNFQAEFPYKEFPMHLLAPNPEKDLHQPPPKKKRSHPYPRPSSSSSSRNDRPSRNSDRCSPSLRNDDRQRPNSRNERPPQSGARHERSSHGSRGDRYPQNHSNRLSSSHSRNERPTSSSSSRNDRLPQTRVKAEVKEEEMHSFKDEPNWDTASDVLENMFK